jgi:hypothetical protein
MGTGAGGGEWRWLLIVILSNEGDHFAVQVLDRVVGDGDLHGDVVVVLVVTDHKPERLEESAEVLVGGAEEVDVENRQLVK